MDPAELRGDCAQCAALCCVVPAFAVSSDFALDKPAGLACPHLGSDDRCTIHDSLRPRGFAGCTAYDCFGAGQRVTQVTFAGRDRRASADVARRMQDVFPVMRILHELLWHLARARAMPAAAPILPGLTGAFATIEALTLGTPDALATLDLDTCWDLAAPLLQQAGDLHRAAAGGPGRDLRGAERLGAVMRGSDLRRACLRGAVLVGADLTEADLRDADLTGADLRGAILDGTDLCTAIFVTQSQLDSAHGNAATRIPLGVERPRHWAR